MKNPKKSGGIAKYVLTLLVAAITSAQIVAFGMADFRVYQDMKSDIAEIEWMAPRQQISDDMNPGSVHYAGLGRIVIDGEVMQKSTSDGDKRIVQTAVAHTQQSPSAQQSVQTQQTGSTAATHGSQNQETPQNDVQNNSQAVSKPVSHAQSQSGSGSGSSPGSKEQAGSWGESSTTNEITGSLDKPAYWVDGGKSYHFSQDCVSLSRSKNIRSGTLQDAINAGKTDPCNNCADGT